MCFAEKCKQKQPATFLMLQTGLCEEATDSQCRMENTKDMAGVPRHTTEQETQKIPVSLSKGL